MSDIQEWGGLYGRECVCVVYGSVFVGGILEWGVYESMCVYVGGGKCMGVGGAVWGV